LIKRIFKLPIPAVLAVIVFSLTGCDSSEPPELKQAASVIRYLTAPVNLSRSAFWVAYPDGKPSEFVSYMFSTMGLAEWPPRNDEFDEFELEAIRSMGTPLVPSGVSFFPRHRQSGMGTQVVIGYDDARGVVIVEGYGPTGTEPVLRREFTLPKVSPAPGVDQVFESNARMGMDIQSFDPTE
jgi:hypothetical protein